ncbi:MAG: YHS domain-containing (seleno)protein [Methylotenera sp.]
MKRLTIAIFALSSLILSSFAYAGGSKVELGGYCPVGYVAAQKVVYGDPKYASEFEGKLYYLSSEGAKKIFDAEPAKFAHATKYESYCATGVALGKKLDTDPNLFTNVDGTIYLFSSQGAKDAFDKDPKAMIAKAEANWPKIRNKAPKDL